MKIPPARVTIPEWDYEQIVSDWEAILRSGRMTLGPLTEELESEFASHPCVYARAMSAIHGHS